MDVEHFPSIVGRHFPIERISNYINKYLLGSFEKYLVGYCSYIKRVVKMGYFLQKYGLNGCGASPSR